MLCAALLDPLSMSFQSDAGHMLSRYSNVAVAVGSLHLQEAMAGCALQQWFLAQLVSSLHEVFVAVCLTADHTR